MSRIDDLIRELCPNGVPFLSVAELFETRGGYTPSKSDVNNWTDGTIPWFRMEDIRENGRVLDDAIQRVPDSALKGGRKFPANSIIVATSATIGEHALITVPFLANQRFTALTLKPEHVEEFDIKFVFYYCFILDEWCRRNTTTSSFATVDMSGFKRFTFPVPPVEVQREIVRVLDLFQSLEAELEAELEARRRQYAFYRNQLLTFGEAAGVRLIPLSELGSWAGGVTPSREVSRYWDSGTIPWVASMDISATSGAVIRGRVTQAAVDETSLRVIPGPSIAVVMRSNILRRYLPVGYVEVDAAANQDMRLLTPREGIEPRYAYQALLAASEGIRAACVRTAGSMAAVDSKSFFSWKIPVPPLDEQRRIVAILDKFDTLVNDLSVGLPAELAARRQQYAHYRDRLLTFDEAAA